MHVNCKKVQHNAKCIYSCLIYNHPLSKIFHIEERFDGAFDRWACKESECCVVRACKFTNTTGKTGNSHLSVKARISQSSRSSSATQVSITTGPVCLAGSGFFGLRALERRPFLWGVGVSAQKNNGQTKYQQCFWSIHYRRLSMSKNKGLICCLA